MIGTMTMRTLAYWKARQIELRNALAAADSTSEYWSDLWRAYKYARDKVMLIERKVLVEHTINRN